GRVMVERERIVTDVLLGGARRTSTRPRGFVPWRPQSATQELLDQVNLILQEYVSYLPLTLRQVFYRLVGKYDYEKTEHAYNRLSEHLTRARRARLIDMSAIRDDGGVKNIPWFYRDADDFLEKTRRAAAQLRLDRQAGQSRRLLV